ncbi:AI-2E family transporter [Salipaludibacillus sp. CF4.18]|uniref:AI-2E family transporter n=1 Tax=Salipaludibacillus sp. CF4.18 TaxID=3373081 RepID=UPI003EE76307
MPTTKWFKFLYGLVLLLIAVNLAVQVPFIFQPIGVAFSTIAPVLIIGGVLYYILRPLVGLLNKKLPNALSIVLIFLAFAGIVTGLIMFVGPILVGQITQLVENFPNFVETAQTWLNGIMQSNWVAYIQNEQAFQEFDTSTITDNLSGIFSNMSENIMSFFAALFTTVTVIVIMPFVLFFLLKDAHRLPDNVLRFLPKEQVGEGQRILTDMDETLSAYIQGQAIVSVFVGALSLIAYLIIGVDYALILAIVAMFTNLIPFIGPFIGTMPAVFVALFQNPVMALWVILAIVVIQQIEGNVISPNVMGRKLHIHPLTIILVLLIAANLAGLVGLILAIPSYAIGKVVVQNIYRLLRLRYPQIR